MKKLEEIKRKLKEMESLLKERFKVKKIAIFGSYAKKKEKKKSDIDLLVEFEEKADLFHLVGLSIFLEEKLGQKIDVVPKRSLRKEIKESVLKELIYL